MEDQRSQPGKTGEPVRRNDAEGDQDKLDNDEPLPFFQRFPGVFAVPEKVVLVE